MTALTSASKIDQVRSIGADRVICRDDEAQMLASLGELAVDVVIDNVGGLMFSHMLAALRLGGRYVTAGAIAGPLVTLDMRTLYLRDLKLIGCTAWDEPVFANLRAGAAEGLRRRMRRHSAGLPGDTRLFQRYEHARPAYSAA